MFAYPNYKKGSQHFKVIDHPQQTFAREHRTLPDGRTDRTPHLTTTTLWRYHSCGMQNRQPRQRHHTLPIKQSFGSCGRKTDTFDAGAGNDGQAAGMMMKHVGIEGRGGRYWFKIMFSPPKLIVNKGCKFWQQQQNKTYLKIKSIKVYLMRQFQDIEII